MKKKQSIFTRMGAWIKKEAEKLRPLSWKQRLEYFRMYYMIPLTIAMVAATFVIWAAVTVIANSNNEIKLYVHIAGITEGSYSQWVEDYETARGYNENQSLRMSQGQYSQDNAIFSQSVNVYAATESLDVLVCDDGALESMITMGLTQELTGILDEETTALAQNKLQRIELPVTDHDGNVEEMLTGYYYVDITGSPLAQTLLIEGNTYLLVSVNTPRAEEINAFFQYVLTQQ